MASKNPTVRAIEVEAAKRAAADGKSSKAERFAIRNTLRGEAGLAPEEHRKGGVAGFVERNPWAVPVAALAAPFALPAIGGALGVGGAAAGAAGAGGSLLSKAVPALGGLLGKAGDFLGSDTGRGLLGAVTALDAAAQRRRADDLTNEAVGRDLGRWEDAAPLRDAGMSALLSPVPVDTSRLSGIAARGNPFAAPPVPAPTLASPALGGPGAVPALPSGPTAAPGAPSPAAAPPRAVPALPPNRTLPTVARRMPTLPGRGR